MPAIFDKVKEKLHIKSDSPAVEISPKKEPAFDQNKVAVVFVLGGPGAGKGTQSAMLVQSYDFSHLSAGDLLRAEQNREGSEFGSLIQTCIKEGAIVPMEITIKLLENAMKTEIQQKQGKPGWKDGMGRFLIDGFPRKMDQALKFEEDVCISSLVIFYTTSEEVMLDRLLERGKTSGREDDNVESIKKRFRTYKEQTMPVIEHYDRLGKVAKIDSSGSIEEIHNETRQWIDKVLSKQSKQSK